MIFLACKKYIFLVLLNYGKQPNNSKEKEMTLTFHSVAEIIEFYNCFRPVAAPVAEEPVAARVAEEPVAASVAAPVAASVAAPVEAAPVEAELDSEGNQWNPEIHSMNKSKTKNGTWRLKRGVNTEEKKPSVLTEIFKMIEDDVFDIIQLQSVLKNYGMTRVNDMNDADEDVIEKIFDELKAL